MILKKIFAMPASVVVFLVTMTILVGCGGVEIEDYLLNDTSAPYDPSRSVYITDFIPKSGGVGQQLVIKGDNFGNDTSIVSVVIGGQDAPLVSVKGDCLYCYVPSGAFTGEIQLTVGEEGQQQTAMADETFEYERAMVVSTLAGYKNSNDDQGWQTGSFETCAGFRNDAFMAFSRYNDQEIYVVYDKEPNWETVHAIQRINLADQTVEDMLPTSLFTGTITLSDLRLRTIDFSIDPFYYEEDGTRDGRLADKDEDTRNKFENNTLQNRWSEHIIVALDYYDTQYTAPTLYIVSRDIYGEFSGNSSAQLLAAYNQCNGCGVHPVNGEVYFSSYTQGQMLRCDMDAFWDTLDTDSLTWDPYANTSGYINVEFPLQQASVNCYPSIHPSGDYAYIVGINRNCLLKTHYNWERKTFAAPYLFTGQYSSSGGEVDGVGRSAMYNRPYQGAFSVNPDYEAAGKSDIYDFYCCDSNGHTIRCTTPEGVVSTYAGGGGDTHPDGLSYGSENGELRTVARFYRPTGFVTRMTDEVLDVNGNPTRIFYIVDTNNCLLRTIGYEH